MGKTAVFVLSVLQQLDPVDGEVGAIVICHTRELAYQICHEFERFSVYLPGVRVANFFGGLPIKQHKDALKSPTPPHIVVGTPGRVKQLAKEGDLKLGSLRHFVIDECDKVKNLNLNFLTYLTFLTFFSISFLTSFLPLFKTPLFFAPLGSRQRRDALRRPGGLQAHAARQAGDDVLRDARQGDPPDLQKVHDRRE